MAVVVAYKHRCDVSPASRDRDEKLSFVLQRAEYYSHIAKSCKSDLTDSRAAYLHWLVTFAIKKYQAFLLASWKTVNIRDLPKMKTTKQVTCL